MKRTKDGPHDALDKKKRRIAGDASEPSAKERSKNETALDPPRVLLDETYRIAVIGFWWETHALSGVIDHAYGQIFDGHPGPQKIALHAGRVEGPPPWPAGPEKVSEAASMHKVSVLFETMVQADRAAYQAYDSRKGALPVEIYQRFADSKEANANPAMVAELIEDCAPGRERTINLGGLRVGLLICGENNVLTNDQNDGNRAFVRHQPDAKLFEGVPVIFNGAHNPMGNWSKIDQRLKLLSEHQRWAFYATNCENYSWGSSTVRGYYNGALVADSSMKKVKPPPDVKVKCVQDDKSKDRYLALVFDIPGHLLALAANHPPTAQLLTRFPTRHG